MELDDAYANAAYVPGADDYPDKWEREAAAFRTTSMCECDVIYGESPRQRLDFFHPDRLAKGLIVFVHGGYWLRFDKSFWSHLAAGPLAHGWAVAMPSYDLCPDVRIGQIGDQVAAAIALAASRVLGPIRLAGHSAGGQLVARMTAPRLGARWQERVEKVVPISPVADLAPLMKTSMNETLRIDAEEAQAESPVHLPRPSASVTVWVGAEERPAFLKQAQALSDAWGCAHEVVLGQHHFNVVEDLADPGSALAQTIAG
ncbi:alpha/beta hydrolase [Cognatiyoonia sp. IB215182]|uniref:alpha/beta hydrolase n=1 Tax=Cognatiyoonia sp. IB215182 TaxID=3097353 RepID=UPI002A0D6FD8|nr:alpha/beta hydrolase fold domain-containing protein [Cognatiyoonia sp. IB215182]MDX8351575.1 alpha/beta hydrolase fold domain-containing protein [Cognatiyoonia sp. IB215182]